MNYRLDWSERALSQLETAAEWSLPQAEAVVNAMERLAASGLSLGRSVPGTGLHYWPVPPLGVLYRVLGPSMVVVAVVDRRRRSSPQL